MSLSSFPSSQKIPTRSHYLKIKQYLPTPIPLGAVIYHRGGITRKRDNTDVELDFRQESDFLYLSGVEAAGYHIVIVLASDRICLIRPTITPSEQLWKGIPDSDSVLLEKYDVDIIVTEDELHAMFMHHDQVIYSLSTTDISALPHRCQNRIDTVHLPAAINEARLTKFPWELDMMRYAAHISSHAHMALMIECAKRHRSQHMNEAELEALFRWVCSKNGLARQCYIPIVASGPRAAVLHYTDNNKSIPDNALVLVDAGGEYRCYGSDVTRTFPVTGQFTQEQKTIYNIVLKAQNAALNQLKPGVIWREIHQLVVNILCSELVRIGILIGEPKELIRLGVYRAFYFHGTGHSVGIDCHDVGGKDIGILNINDDAFIYRGRRKGLGLETLTRPLEKDMVVTVEPGLYFNNVSIDLWTSNPDYKQYFDMERINHYRVIGGVRIEDTVVITSSGYENFTIVPKEIEDIEAIMQCNTPTSN